MLSIMQLAVVVMGVGVGVGGLAAEASSQESRDLQRTPVGEVLESARDAVVNISSTEIVQSDPFYDFLDLPRRRSPGRCELTATFSITIRAASVWHLCGPTLGPQQSGAHLRLQVVSFISR